jgi:hypothetical protein
MTETQEIPADVMAEARSIAISLNGFATNDDFVRIARALQARDTAARKECVEIAREAQRNSRRNRISTHPDLSPYHLWAEQQANNIATAIEATITGGGDE